MADKMKRQFQTFENVHYSTSCFRPSNAMTSSSQKRVQKQDSYSKAIRGGAFVSPRNNAAALNNNIINNNGNNNNNRIAQSNHRQANARPGTSFQFIFVVR